MRVDDDAVLAAALYGIGGRGGPLPHQDRIQASFGHHDVSGIEAHVGGDAAVASAALGAEAFATGHHVAFAGAPTLHTAAHEAAHVVQQRAGRQLKSGLGDVGDVYERHADEVADRVVRGESAEATLDRMAPRDAPRASVGPVQRKVKLPGGDVLGASDLDALLKHLSAEPDIQLDRSKLSSIVQCLLDDEAVISFADAKRRILSKTLVTLTFDLPPAQVGQTAMFKATSLGSMLTEGGIGQQGLDPRLGGQGGGSGVWEGPNAPDRIYNVGWSTLTTSEAGTADYARGFELERLKRSQEEHDRRRTTGKLNAKWIGVTLRVLVKEGDLKDATRWRPDPGSARDSGAWQTTQRISPRDIDVRSITMMLSAEAYRELQQHIASNEGQVSLEFLEALLEDQYYVPSTWDPRQV